VSSVNDAPPVEYWLDREPATMILQPNSFCPLACTYCYLPGKHRWQEMRQDTVRAIASSIPESWGASKPLEVIWHCGEPLVVGQQKFTALIEPFETLRKEGRVQHKIQTNAALINDAWCDLFERYDIAIGVSIDGPQHINKNRVNRHGRPMFERIVAGIEKLIERDIPFTTLAVVTADAVGHAGETLDFLAGLGCTWIGFNMEDPEGANTNCEPPTISQATRFWVDAFDWGSRHLNVTIRDLDRLLKFLGLDRAIQSRDGTRDLIPTISWDGDVVLLSPELLGVKDEKYGDFVAGNIHVDGLPTILERAPTLRYVREFTNGLNKCKQTCEFWNYCQGAHAGDRYFEHGTFEATETSHCRTSFQAPVLALSELINQRKAS
jgi:uncharacterized protein